MMKIVVALAIISLASCAIRSDLMSKVPGYGDHFQQNVYSGYLNTSSPNRRLHYVFVESINNVSNKDPVTLWLNGGPGCSSLLGFLQEIGPFYLPEGIHYKVGDTLVENPYSWHKLSNLLFIESPSGVGYSINDDTNFTYNDQSTATDNLDALLFFFANYPEYSDNTFWIAGQSYAGKYIPDLAVKIDYYNGQGRGKKVNLKGLLVGNGVMSMLDLEQSQIEYMINHEFIDPELLIYYESSCQTDPLSAGCRYFKMRFSQNVEEINPYNVYSYCYYNDSFTSQSSSSPMQSQQSILMNIAQNQKYNRSAGMNGAPCAYFDGLLEYFNAHQTQYHGKKWNGPCNENITAVYEISMQGSISAYRFLLSKIADYHIVLYSGDWDDVVPYTDTIKNLERLNLEESYVYTPFFANDQHAGWMQLYSGILFVTMKGASHQVPQSKRPQAFELFKQALDAHNIESMLTNR